MIIRWQRSVYARRGTHFCMGLVVARITGYTAPVVGGGPRNLLLLGVGM
jgi:hypothetical protein